MRWGRMRGGDPGYIRIKRGKKKRNLNHLFLSDSINDPRVDLIEYFNVFLPEWGTSSWSGGKREGNSQSFIVSPEYLRRGYDDLRTPDNGTTTSTQLYYEKSVVPNLFHSKKSKISGWKWWENFWERKVRGRGIIIIISSHDAVGFYKWWLQLR